jgi:hypothetical protein
LLLLINTLPGLFSGIITLLFGDYYCTWIVFGDYYVGDYYCTWILFGDCYYPPNFFGDLFGDYYCTHFRGLLRCFLGIVNVLDFGDYSGDPTRFTFVPTTFPPRNHQLIQLTVTLQFYSKPRSINNPNRTNYIYKHITLMSYEYKPTFYPNRKTPTFL